MGNKGDGFGLKAAGGTIAALLLCAGLFLAGNALLPFKQLGPRSDPSCDQSGVDIAEPIHEGSPPVFHLQAALSAMMLLLSLYLFYIYLKDYLQLRSGFTLGLMGVIFSFMLFAIAANPLIHVFFDVYGSRGMFQIVPYFFATSAMALLVYLSSK